MSGFCNGAGGLIIGGVDAPGSAGFAPGVLVPGTPGIGVTAPGEVGAGVFIPEVACAPAAALTPTVPANNVELLNQRTLWTHTLGLGLRIKTPVGGEFGIDYGRLLNPSRFLIPQPVGPNAIYQLRQDHIHFRFSQAF